MRMPAVLGRELPAMTFLLTAEVRRKLGLGSAPLTLAAGVLTRDDHAIAALAAVHNTSSSSVTALALVHECLHAVLAWYTQHHEPDLWTRLGTQLRAAHGDAYDALLCSFIAMYPPPEVFAGTLTPRQFVSRDARGEAWALEEWVLLELAQRNPAYAVVSASLTSAEFNAAPGRGALREYVLQHALLAHGAASPTLAGKRYANLGELLSVHVAENNADPFEQLAQLQAAFAQLAADGPGLGRVFTEVGKLREQQLAAAGFERSAVPGAFVPPDFSTAAAFEDHRFAGGSRDSGGSGDSGEAAQNARQREQASQAQTELELVAAARAEDHAAHVHGRFTVDRPWMPEVVLIAKSTLVWLVQLERAYERPVRTLADIPDEELVTLRRRGINALWLIGIWRRSRASREIKRKMGNPDAAASAYSLDDYIVSAELGGEEALESLRVRALAHGLRLASDMVPNHMGLDSVWLEQHPEWFLSVAKPPFANYRFTGPDLGGDRFALRLEDGYFDKTDAAVVFECVERRTGKARYVYHGNDGTSTPWNDTAQLNFVLPEVREALLSTIVRVAKRFPIIRFDAAMTLARQHVRRLWHPPLGDAGGVPSRAQYALSDADFERMMPREFWREAVERIAKEAPDTLLLAEAFWMMEGYFVRSLGMHRVYNSAFMHMLKHEDNAGYRRILKDVLRYDPEVLGRFVNFMNNPDEEPAKNQFGVFEKYFGICTLLATLPGLPMFGHGQFEGFAEKYGMEFTRPQWDEPVDHALLAHHERIVSPLLQMRAVFAGARDFRLYDYVRDDGSVDEDVYAFSNRLGAERVLVLVRNGGGAAHGTLHLSAAFARDGGEVCESLAVALGLEGAEHFRFAAPLANREEIRSLAELTELGFEITVGAYESIVFASIEGCAAPSIDVAAARAESAPSDEPAPDLDAEPLAESAPLGAEEPSAVEPVPDASEPAGEGAVGPAS